MENKTKARCQLGNKAMKTKQTTKHGEKRKREQKYKVKQRQIKKIYIYSILQWEKNSRKNKQKSKCRENNNKF